MFRERKINKIIYKYMDTHIHKYMHICMYIHTKYIENKIYKIKLYIHTYIHIYLCIYN